MTGSALARYVEALAADLADTARVGHPLSLLATAGMLRRTLGLSEDEARVMAVEAHCRALELTAGEARLAA